MSENHENHRSRPRTLGELSPAERDAAIKNAVRRLEAELRANAPRIAAILEDQPWVDALLADTPPVEPNPHYHCNMQDVTPCPTGEHTNPYPIAGVDYVRCEAECTAHRAHLWDGTPLESGTK